MVQVTQKAFAACLNDPKPCADALSNAASMKQSDALRQFEYSAKVSKVAFLNENSQLPE